MFQIGEVIAIFGQPASVAESLRLSPAVRLIAGIFWALLFGFAVVLITRQTQRALTYTAALLLAYTAYSVAQVVILTEADYNRQRLPFLIAVILIFLSIPFFLSIRLMREQSRTLTQTETLTDGSQPQNSKS
ncbi:MAG: hypothetical protein H7Y09_14255 [Chitinophagaceae bacterium]|nr:hypothetical protein [Anaerolineae bacterium]